MNLTYYRQKINEIKVERTINIRKNKELAKQIADNEQTQQDLQEALVVLQKAAKTIQNKLAIHFSAIVTKALNVVFPDKNISFHMKFIERRNTSECDLWLEENGYKYSIFGGKGFGVVDIVSFALHVTYVFLCQKDNVLIIDEPFRNLHRSRHKNASYMVKILSKELKMQFIIATHMTNLQKYSDSSFFVELVNEESQVIQEK